MPHSEPVQQFITEYEVVSRTLSQEILPSSLKPTEIAPIVGSTPEYLSLLLCQMEHERVLDRAIALFN